MTSHLGLMIVFAACVAAVFGALLRDDVREQVHLTVRIFGGLVAGAYALGWVMFAVFR
jgi:uncharacterized protein (DUF697 family)